MVFNIKNRVHITGIGTVSSLGHNFNLNWKNVLANKTNVKIMDDWKTCSGLHSHIAAIVPDFDVKFIPRSTRRTMSKMSEMIFLAAHEALTQSGLSKLDLNKLNVGINVGSSSGSVTTMNEFYGNLNLNKSTQGLKATSMFKSMSHTAAVNLASALDFHGPVTSTNSACASGAHAIILMWELISAGIFDIGIVGGCDEADLSSCLCFDLAGAASRNFNDRPQLASRPFDHLRDGLVTSEGAGVLIIESEASMLRRSVSSLAEIKSGAYICDSSHMSQPQKKAMMSTMIKALERANLKVSDIDYVNAHATSTQLGDLYEAQAIYELFQSNIPISSLKGHLGHTFGASGAIEAAFCSKMLNEKIMIGTKNLDEVDKDMPELNFLKNHQEKECSYILSNNFALGGINTTLIFAKNNLSKN